MNRKQERERKIIARMSCGHGRDYKWCYRPDLDSALWCYVCHKIQTVTAHEEEYRIKCETCRYSRGKGQGKLGAEIDASKHHMRNPSHRIVMTYGKEELHVWKPQTEKLFTEALPSDPVQPPF